MPSKGDGEPWFTDTFCQHLAYGSWWNTDKCLRPIWEKQGLFLFFPAAIQSASEYRRELWRILNGKWLRPADYISTDNFLYATNRALAALGTELNINFAYAAFCEIILRLT